MWTVSLLDTFPPLLLNVPVPAVSGDPSKRRIPAIAPPTGSPPAPAAPADPADPADAAPTAAQPSHTTESYAGAVLESSQDALSGPALGSNRSECRKRPRVETYGTPAYLGCISAILSAKS
jgi:hypothetical protein